ncbi:hypothetical protein SAMN04488689_101304 [Paenibacillus sp. cl6col]|nr:hypothetical protein SAMN04488689_101304 [Paenibacillus sp. cl6col]
MLLYEAMKINSKVPLESGINRLKKGGQIFCDQKEHLSKLR